MSTIRRILECNRGVTMVETTIVLLLLLGLTFAIVEFGRLFWVWNGAEKATKLGVRIAVTADPVALGLNEFDCATSSILLGTRCSHPDAASFGTVTCSGASNSCSGEFGFSESAFDAIFAFMQGVFPDVEPENVEVEYTDVGLSFAGRGSPVPAVTVRLTGMTFDFVVLGGLFGLGPIAMPDFRATLTGEDLSDAGA